MFSLRHNNRNYDVIAVCYDITRKYFFDVKWKPYVRPPIDFAGQSVENNYLSIDLQNYQFIDGKLSQKFFLAFGYY